MKGREASLLERAGEEFNSHPPCNMQQREPFVSVHIRECEWSASIPSEIHIKLEFAIYSQTHIRYIMCCWSLKYSQFSQINIKIGSACNEVEKIQRTFRFLRFHHSTDTNEKSEINNITS